MIGHDADGRSPLVSVSQLGALLESSEILVLDVRWRLERPNGHHEYASGHIPGAIFVDLPTQLAAHGKPTDGRHPLPDIAEFERAVRSWGVQRRREVVVYDDWNGQSAARAWWLLIAAGVTDVRVLDGGLSAWMAAGGGLATGDEQAFPSRITLDGYRTPTLNMDEAADMASAGVLLDARARERYRGESEPMDPVAGHIPGAINAPTNENVDDTGRFLPAETLREQFEKLGVTGTTPVGVYCGSGVTASHEILALAVAGFSAALYPGSWSQWSNHPERPVATGAEP